MTNNIFKRRGHKEAMDKKGFTLVEILATFVLIALILPAVMEGISLAMRLGTRSKHKVEASALAESKLAEVLLSGDYSKGDQSGTFETDDSETAYSWNLAVEDWTTEDSMEQLTMTVGWSDSGGTDHSVALSTLVYVEAESETGS
jgi:prepilin-type N-terminal cleavage/methylation domain-containing protein